MIVLIPATVEGFLTVCQRLADFRAQYEALGGVWPTLEEELTQRAALATLAEEGV